MKVDAKPRRRAAQTFFVIVVVAQLWFLARGYSDPHKHFAFQPFNESSAWRAEIYRVLPDGRRVSIRGGWNVYHWHELVRERGLGQPWGMQHADSGVGSVLDYLQRALDWVATHTPMDVETVRFEADVTYNRNRRGEVTTTLRSVARELDR